jgi:hypothetical protein
MSDQYFQAATRGILEVVDDEVTSPADLILEIMNSGTPGVERVNVGIEKPDFRSGSLCRKRCRR